MTRIIKGMRYELIMISIFILQIAASNGLDLSVSTGAVGSSESMALDDSTAFEGVHKISGSSLMQTHEITGDGGNILKQQISGQGFTVTSVLGGSGDLKSSRFAAASASGADVSDRSQVAGDAGCLSYLATADENSRYLTAGFSGAGGDMDASLAASAGHSADINGAVSVMGINSLESGNDMAVSTSGLYKAADGGLGDFGVTSLNIPGSSSDANQIKADLSNPLPQANKASSYKLAGWRWCNNPELYFAIKTDDNFYGEGLNAMDARQAVINAANTWDAATRQKLFSGVVDTGSSWNNNVLDWSNVIAWGQLSPDVLAYTHVYYACDWSVRGSDGKKYSMALESDICFNTDYNWVTDGNNANSYPKVQDTFDVETVALHELGHVYGLADIYNIADYSQIMNAYDDKQHKLGAGDISGIQKLYGR